MFENYGEAFKRMARSVAALLGYFRKEICHRSRDFSSNIYQIISGLLLLFLLVYSFFLFFFFSWAIYLLNTAQKEFSWNLIGDFIRWNLGILIVFIALRVFLKRWQNNAHDTFFLYPKHLPRMIRNQKIGGYILFTMILFAFAAAFTAPLYSQNVVPDFAKVPLIYISSFLATIASILYFLWLFISPEMSGFTILKYGLEYLSKVQELEQRDYVKSIGFVSREVVEQLHHMFLQRWDFAQQINLWPKFNVVFLGLTVGNKNERSSTSSFLADLNKMIFTSRWYDDPELCRQVVMRLDRFQKSMKSLRKLGDSAALGGNPSSRTTSIERVGRNAQRIVVLAPIISILIRVVQTIFNL